MAKDLTVSEIDRQNILNNPYALKEIQKSIGLKGINYKGKVVFLKEQIANFFGVTPRTIDNYLAQNEGELRRNGFEILRGKSLSELKLLLFDQYGHETDFVTVIKSSSLLGIFDFRAFLNIAMLITDSDRARQIRQVILDVVIDTINKRTGGSTKYINQRDEDFIITYFKEENYRKEFTDALKDYVDMGNVKYPIYTDRIYVSIFKENTQEYRAILRLHEKDKVRDTLYTEILLLISAYENGFADVLRQKFTEIGRKLTPFEVDELFEKFEKQAHWIPFMESARSKMASRDFTFRDALHLRLKNYIKPLEADEFERFIGDKSKELAERLEEAKDVMKRLKDRE